MNIENIKENIIDKIIDKINNLNRKEKTIIVVILSLLAIASGILYFLISTKNFYDESFVLLENENLSNSISLNATIENTTLLEESNTNKDNKEIIKIYITGEVVSPGVIELEEGQRIEDAINKAGGITSMASLDDVNLAYILSDGQKLYIPSVKDKDFENDNEKNKDKNEERETSKDILSTENGKDVIKDDTNESKNKKININISNVEELCEIPGVGKSIAQRIIDYREEKGNFKNIEELKNVSGIGEKKYEGLKDYVRVK